MSDKCEGRPTEPCPYKKNDNTVKWSICKLCLCLDCLEYFEPTKVCNNTGNSNKVKCELLCFIIDKVKILPLGQVVLICADFYEEDAVMAAIHSSTKAFRPRKIKGTTEGLAERMSGQ